MIILFDTNNYHNLKFEYQHKGKWYCFIITLAEKYTQVGAHINGVTDQYFGVNNLILRHDTLDVFKIGKNPTEYYHGIFDTS